MGRTISFATDEYYHIYNRGNDKRVIFQDENDRRRFIHLLYLTNGINPIVVRDLYPSKVYTYERGEALVSIGAYCLMPNHFHILLRAKSPEGVSLFMRKLSTGYSMYFNLKYKRTGRLTEGPFKAVHIESDTHLKYLFAYIHLNPLKLLEANWKNTIAQIQMNSHALQYLHSYPYSSFLDYTNVIRTENSILTKEAFPDYFGTNGNFLEYITEIYLTEDYPL